MDYCQNNNSYNSKDKFEVNSEYDYRSGYSGRHEHNNSFENNPYEKNENGNGKRELKNKASVEVEICGKKHKFESNEVQLKKAKLTIFKEESCGIAFDDDLIKYTVTIFNEGRADLCDLEFKDMLAEDLKFERNSFAVNGQSKYAEFADDTIAYKIPELKAGQKSVITFDVKV